jgi:hypothetical protein
MTIPTDLIDLRKAREISGRSRTTLKERIRKGTLPAWREGREYFVRREHVERLFTPVVPPTPAMTREALKEMCDRVVFEQLGIRPRERAHLNK